MEANKYNTYVNILKEELVPAMGCTEPIALAYCAAKAKDTLNEEIIESTLYVSHNIVKNVKSVVVPHTGGLVGLKAAYLAGIIAGDSSLELEVLANTTKEDEYKIKKCLDTFPLNIEIINDGHIFDIAVKLKGKNHTSYVRICDDHTNITEVKYDDKYIFQKDCAGVTLADRSLLNVKDIINFADIVNIDDVKEVIERQINYNFSICSEGLKNNYGANIGKVYFYSNLGSLETKAKAYAAAGSDARMNGCEMPVVINSGSGNQGITTSIPVIIYAKELLKSQEELIRALVVSNLITIHLKSGIGTLSAYCGVVSAGAGAAAGISYLLGKKYNDIAPIIVNTLAIDSGIICDGAKSSCAAKIATAVETGLLGIKMHESGNDFTPGSGIVRDDVEQTIVSVNRLASKGMLSTDEEIIKIMLEM